MLHCRKYFSLLIKHNHFRVLYSDRLEHLPFEPRRRPQCCDLQEATSLCQTDISDQQRYQNDKNTENAQNQRSWGELVKPGEDVAKIAWFGTTENIKIVKYRIYNFVAENQMRLDLLVCQRGAVRNGSLALIKALRLAGSLHQLKVDYFAPMWDRIILRHWSYLR